MSEGIASMLRLEGLLQIRRKASSLVNRVRDASRFILYHKWAIENSPLQVYSSALIFSPARSITRNWFKKEEPEWVITEPAMEDDWSPCLQTLEGHSDGFWSVAWSHDATRLASASSDDTVKIWDPATGQCLSTLDIGRVLMHLRFDKSNSDYLHTDVSTVNLQPATTFTALATTSSDCLSSLPQQVGYGLNRNRTWITYEGQNLLWLPPEYRPLSSAISGTVVAIGCSSGCVLMLTFSDNPAP